ncbi:MAG: DUF4337 domain-containing protein [Pseudomonadota bacterium]|jgi:hypothetical protein|nr:DUF4337 domain-containing protein [Pseudomonadota bacterium]
MPHDAALEAHEHAEHAEHAAHEADPFIGRVSITIAILAVLAAAAGSLETVEAGGAITSSSEAVLKQDQATDNWGFANSKAIRKNLYLIAEDQSPANKEAYEKSEKKAEADEEKAHEKAQDFEKERDQLLVKSAKHERSHHWLTIAATLLEVGIAICTVAIITKRRSFWFGSMALGAVGAVLLATVVLAITGVIALPLG